MSINKKEIDLNIKDIIWEFFRRWRLIVVCAIAGAVLFAGIRYASDYKAANTPKVVVEEKDTTVEEAYAELNKDEMEEVIGAVQLNAYIDAKAKYMDESILMSINPFEEPVVILQYYVNGENADNAVKGYVDYIVSGSINQAVKENSGFDLAENYFSELVVVDNPMTEGTSSFAVKVIYSDSDNCAVLAGAVKEALNAYGKTLASSGVAHNLVLVSEEATVVIDTELAKMQSEYANDLAESQSTLAKTKSEMDGNQLVAYLDMERKIFIWGEEEATEEVEENVESEEIVEPAPVKVSISKTQLVLGAVVGAALAVVYIFMAYLLTGKLRTKDEMESLYDTVILGTVASLYTQKKSPFAAVDHLIWRLAHCSAKQLSFEQEVKMIISNIYISSKEKNVEKVYLTGTLIEAMPKNIIDAVVAGLQEKGINVQVGEAIAYDAEALIEAAETGYVVFVEEKRKSLYSEIYKEVELCDINKISVLGTILLGE